MTNYRELQDLLLDLYKKGDLKALQQLLAEQEPIDVAEFLDELPEDDASRVFRLLPKDLSMDIFVHLDADTQERLVSKLTDPQLSAMIDLVYNDDLADILDEMPANVVKRILANTPAERRHIVNRLLKYPEDSAGSIMTTEYICIDEHLTIAEAFQHLRKSRQKLETVYNLYITTGDNRLVGVLSVRDMFSAKDEALVSDVMEQSVVAVRTTDDQEEVALLFDRYDLLALPVVDSEYRLVGIITVDDAMDIMAEEASEDLSKMAAVSPSKKSYLDISVWEHTKSRLPWLLLFMVCGIINARILAGFEDAFTLVPALVGFIPMLTDTGGNAGSQGAAVIVRSLALQEISYKDWAKTLWKEMRVGFGLGLVLGLVNFIQLFFLRQLSFSVSFTISLSLLIVGIAAKSLGAILPILADRLRLDPAVMAGPLIATAMDAISIVIYFSLAKAILFSQLG